FRVCDCCVAFGVLVLIRIGERRAAAVRGSRGNCYGSVAAALVANLFQSLSPLLLLFLKCRGRAVLTIFNLRLIIIYFQS
ncbi:hypothetical protein GIB67_016373, partial [Kingdonia uniflora]